MPTTHTLEYGYGYVEVTNSDRGYRGLHGTSIMCVFVNATITFLIWTLAISLHVALSCAMLHHVS